MKKKEKGEKGKERKQKKKGGKGKNVNWPRGRSCFFLAVSGQYLSSLSHKSLRIIVSARIFYILPFYLMYAWRTDL